MRTNIPKLIKSKDLMVYTSLPVKLPRTKSWTGFHMESSWIVTGVSVEFDFQGDCQQDMKKDRNSTWKNLESPRGNCPKVLAGILAKIMLTFWHENRAEKLYT